MEGINWQFFMSMLAIAFGYGVKKMKLVTEKDGESLAKIVMNITLPAAIINSFNAVRIDTALILLPVFNLLFGLTMAAVGLHAFRKENPLRRGMLTMTLPGLNLGLFAFPLIESLWGQQGIKYFGMFDIGNAIIIFGVCYVIGAHFSAESGGEADVKSVVKKVFRSVPILVYIATLVLNLSGIGFPVFVAELAKSFAKANGPLSLLLLGIFLNFSFDRKAVRDMAKVLLLRYGVGLTVGIAFYLFLPFDAMFKMTLLIGCILPIATSTIPYSVEFGYDQRLVGTLANTSIVISILFMWIITTYVGKPI